MAKEFFLTGGAIFFYDKMKGFWGKGRAFGECWGLLGSFGQRGVSGKCCLFWKYYILTGRVLFGEVFGNETPSMGN